MSTVSKRIIIEGRNIRLAYTDGRERVDVLDGADLCLEEGQLAALVGRSGSGKTSLLQVLGLLAEPDSGSVLVEGRCMDGLTARARAHQRGNRLGFIFQNSNLLPQHDALTNVALAWRGPRRAGRTRALELLDHVGLSSRARHRPDQLSGGEQQRVAVARALVNDPIAILADEPTGSLDRENELLLIDLLRSLTGLGTAVLLVTHSDAVSSVADVRWLLTAGRVRKMVEAV